MPPTAGIQPTLLLPALGLTTPSHRPEWRTTHIAWGEPKSVFIASLARTRPPGLACSAVRWRSSATSAPRPGGSWRPTAFGAGEEDCVAAVDGAGANLGAGTVTALVSTAADPPLPPMNRATRMGTSGTSTATAVNSGRRDRVGGVGSDSLILVNCCPWSIGGTPVRG